MNEEEKKNQNPADKAVTHHTSQRINAPVNGHIAGRDVIINTTEDKPESQLQAEFAERTGIWCPRSAREWLETLLAEHGFTVRELKVAWGNSSIGWHATKNEKRITTHWFEPFFAWSMVGILTTYMLLFGWNALRSDWSVPGVQLKMWGGAAMMAVVYLGTCWTLSRFILWPRRVAMRVRAKELVLPVARPQG